MCIGVMSCPGRVRRSIKTRTLFGEHLKVKPTHCKVSNGSESFCSCVRKQQKKWFLLFQRIQVFEPPNRLDSVVFSYSVLAYFRIFAHYFINIFLPFLPSLLSSFFTTFINFFY